MRSSFLKLVNLLQWGWAQFENLPFVKSNICSLFSREHLIFPSSLFLSGCFPSRPFLGTQCSCAFHRFQSNKQQKAASCHRWRICADELGRRRQRADAVNESSSWSSIQSAKSWDQSRWSQSLFSESGGGGAPAAPSKEVCGMTETTWSLAFTARWHCRAGNDATLGALASDL